MSVVKEAIRKATGSINAPLECSGCTNSPIYHTGRFHINRNIPNKTDLDVVEHAKRSIQEYTQRNS